MIKIYKYYILALILFSVFILGNRVDALSIVDGDTIRARGDNDIYIIKLTNGKKFKRLILNPQVFNSYGHLKWEKVKIVEPALLKDYITSDLVREYYDTKVYKLIPDGDTGSKQWLNISGNKFSSLGYDWDSIYTINITDWNNYALGKSISSPDPSRSYSSSLTIPTNIGASITACGDAYLTWSYGSNTDINGFEIERGYDTGLVVWDRIIGTTDKLTKNFLDSSKPGGTKYYRARAYNTTQYSNYSNYVTVTFNTNTVYPTNAVYPSICPKHTIQVTSPKDHALLERWTYQVISWQSSKTNNIVDIDFLNIHENITKTLRNIPNTGYYEWFIDDQYINGLYKIRISETNNIYNESATFNIVDPY